MTKFLNNHTLTELPFEPIPELQSNDSDTIIIGLMNRMFIGPPSETLGMTHRIAATPPYQCVSHWLQSNEHGILDRMPRTLPILHS